MERLLSRFRLAYQNEDGYSLAAIFTPLLEDDTDGSLAAFHNATNVSHFERDVRTALIFHIETVLTSDEMQAWIELFSYYWSTLDVLLPLQRTIVHSQYLSQTTWFAAYESWNAFVKCMTSNFNKSIFQYWAVPCLETAAKYLRFLAIRADEASPSPGRGPSVNSTYTHATSDNLEGLPGQAKAEPKLAEAARTIMNIFSTCSGDRAQLDQSRKWGLYAIANVQFKVYFQLNNMRLCKNLVRSLEVADPPALVNFPMAHQVTFNFYMGVIRFLEEDYTLAQQYLDAAWSNCHPGAHSNRIKILVYLISCRIITSHQLPTQQLLAPFPELMSIFMPIASAIKRASLYDFDIALQSGERFLVQKRIYLTLERARDITLRNLFRKVYLTTAHELPHSGQSSELNTARTRIPIDEFVTAVRFSSNVAKTGDNIGRDEVECLIANMIYKNLMKGYIHRERAILVLSKAQPFPGTTT